VGEVKLDRDGLINRKERTHTMKKKMGKRKYKVEYKQTETFIVDVYANNQEQAEKLASRRFDAGDYQEIGDCDVEVNQVYDVTNTDDPFNP